MAGTSNINHYLESEENNNIPEINSFVANQVDEGETFKVITSGEFTTSERL